MNLWVQILSSAVVCLSVGGAVLMVVRCKHPWELVDKTELPAPIEAARRAGVEGTFAPWHIIEMSKKTIILALRCPKCGATKLWKETA